MTLAQRPTAMARMLRRASTPSERTLWHHLSRRQIAGAKFSRQMPVAGYIRDFLCRSHHLTIEIDGESHDAQLEYDAARPRRLMQAGYRMIRFTNADVYERIEGVLTLIERALADGPTPSPSRQREGYLIA